MKDNEIELTRREFRTTESGVKVVEIKKRKKKKPPEDPQYREDNPR